MTLSLRVGAAWNAGDPNGGQWLHGLVPFGDLSFATTLRRCADNNSGGGGLLTVGFTVAVPPGMPLPSQLRQDSLVEVFAGGWPLGAAVVSETPRGNTVTADGLFRLGESFLALDASGNPTTKISVAVAQAITRGLRWRNPGALPSSSVSTLSEDMARLNTISAVLNAYCSQNNKVWWIDRHGFLRIGDLPVADTAQTWALSPSVPNPETADEDYVSAYYVRRVNSLDADGQPTTWATNSATDATAPMAREVGTDIGQMGVRTSAEGTAAAQAYLDANKARPGFTEGVSVARGQIATTGGVAPELWAVAAGDVVTQPNWLSASGAAAAFRQGGQWVVGGTTWKQGEPLTVTPLGLVPRTVAQVIQAEGGRPELVFK